MFQNIITSMLRADSSAAETHRQTVISIMDNALASHSFPPEQEQRLQRLVKSLRDAEAYNPARKMDLIRQSVIPALVHMGLVEYNGAPA